MKIIALILDPGEILKDFATSCENREIPARDKYCKFKLTFISLTVLYQGLIYVLLASYKAGLGQAMMRLDKYSHRIRFPVDAHPI